MQITLNPRSVSRLSPTQLLLRLHRLNVPGALKHSSWTKTEVEPQIGTGDEQEDARERGEGEEMREVDAYAG